jgi:hypothetical protein
MSKYTFLSAAFIGFISPSKKQDAEKWNGLFWLRRATGNGRM